MKNRGYIFKTLQAGFVCLLAVWGSASQAAVGEWLPTGSMVNRRIEHTATLLSNGKVLVVGGSADRIVTNTAELYDPATGTFSPTGSMGGPRNLHTATPLPNGKVLVVGAGFYYYYGNTAELYDPATGTFSATGSMENPRGNHTATLLPNGKVLIVGGIDSSRVLYLNTAELYDPATGTFSATGSMGAPRYGHIATLLPNGKVLVTGGIIFAYTNFAELYDPSTGTFSAIGSGTPRYSHTATLLPNGKVLVTGGYSVGGPLLSSAELYDPSTGTFSATGSMGTIRVWHTATLLPNGKVLVAGGYNGDRLDSAELYDPATGTFFPTGSMITARDSHKAVPLSNGKVLVVGGFNNNNGGSYLNIAELYDGGPPAGNIVPPLHDEPGLIMTNTDNSNFATIVYYNYFVHEGYNHNGDDLALSNNGARTGSSDTVGMDVYPICDGNILFVHRKANATDVNSFVKINHPNCNGLNINAYYAHIDIDNSLPDGKLATPIPVKISANIPIGKVLLWYDCKKNLKTNKVKCPSNSANSHLHLMIDSRSEEDLTSPKYYLCNYNINAYNQVESLSKCTKGTSTPLKPKDISNNQMVVYSGWGHVITHGYKDSLGVYYTNNQELYITKGAMEELGFKSFFDLYEK